MISTKSACFLLFIIIFASVEIGTAEENPTCKWFASPGGADYCYTDCRKKGGSGTPGVGGEICYCWMPGCDPPKF
ncbi:hypothetical protein ACHQM5_019382 [Ranunculus cassubicifolius]